MAQGAKDFKISEVYVHAGCCAQQADSQACTARQSEYRDEYGEPASWIEISNESYTTHDLRNCYITNDRSVLNPDLTAPERISKMSLVHRGDKRTLLAGHERITFFADGRTNRGLLHLGFTLRPGESNWIALYDGNGVTMLDTLLVPALESGQSYSRHYNAQSGEWEAAVTEADQVTPDAPNAGTAGGQDKVAEWKDKDPHGIAMAIISMSIVFGCLILLFVFFHIFGWSLNRIAKLNRVKAIRHLHEKAEKLVVMAKEGTETRGIETENYVAAIALALHEYSGAMHDVESGVITIAQHPTEWENKEHLLRHTPEVHHNN